MRLVQSSRQWEWVVFTALFLVCLPAPAGAQDLGTDSTNGISVGSPKVFDNRSLSIMLDQLSAQLQAIQTINSTTVNAALGNQQGAESHSKSLSGSLAASAVPGAAAAADKANPQPPSAPGAATLPTAPSYSPTFGQNAGDLLSDQVNLSYQIFNLRMLLERALSDRLYEKKTRLQTVLGFQVTLDPPKNTQDRAAFVEITVCPSTPGQEHCDRTLPAPSLVALMPYEKTYNSSALSQSSTAFGGSAVFQVFSLGVNAQQQDQVFYLFRDSDTLAMERMQRPPDAPANSITFGWQFRPVLGRRSVSPGIRQMFAVVALPEIDEGVNPANLKVTVRTFWRKYDRNLLTTSKVVDYLRGPYPYPAAVEINTSESYESDLEPEVTDFEWVTAGANTAVVSFSGKNFFPGTQIQVGDKPHSDTSSGLLIKSGISMELTVSLQDLAAGEAFISGRYGRGITEPTERDCRTSGIAINSIHLAHLLGRAEQRLDIVLQDREGKDLDLGECLGLRPLVKLGDTLLPEPYGQEVDCETGQEDDPDIPSACYQLSTFVKSSLVTGSDLVAVRYPFRGPKWSSALVFSPRSPLVIRYDKTNGATILRISGEKFDDTWAVSLDKLYKIGSSSLKLEDKFLFFTVDDKTLAKYKQVALLPPFDFDPLGAPVVVDIPADTASAEKPAAKPEVDATKSPAPVVQGSAPAVVVSGKALSTIKRVTFEDENLPFQVATDGTSLTVILSRRVTRKPGSAVLILRPASGDFLPVTITVSP